MASYFFEAFGDFEDEG
jgi:hypothetical protein